MGVWQRTNDHAKVNGPPSGWLASQVGPVWWAGQDSGPYIGPHGPRPYGAANQAAVTQAVRIIADGITSAGWEVTGGDLPRWLSDPMLTRPDGRYDAPLFPASRRMTGPTFWSDWVRSALLWGMGYLAFEPAADGTPLPGQMFLIHPGHVSAVQRTDGQHGPYVARRIAAHPTDQRSGGYWDTDFNGEFRTDAGTYRLLELRNRGVPVDPDTGMTPGTLSWHTAQLGLAESVTDYAAGTFSSGVPSGILKIDSPHITQSDADAAREGWNTAHGQGHRGIAILNAATAYEPISISPVDAQLVEMYRMTLVDVALAFGVPFDMVGAPSGDSMTYANVSQRYLALVRFTLQPWADQISATLSRLLPEGSRVHVDFAEEVMSDASTVGVP